MARLKDKVALITGAGTGVGRACMEMFAKEGARVIGVSRTQANLDETLSAVSEAGGSGIVVAADLSTPEGAQRAFDAAMAEYGRVDVLVNAAGVGYNYQDDHPGTMDDTVNTTPEAWHQVLALNLDPTFYMCRLVIPGMQKRGGGSIVNVTSISGFQPDTIALRGLCQGRNSCERNCARLHRHAHGRKFSATIRGRGSRRFDNTDAPRRYA